MSNPDYSKFRFDPLVTTYSPQNALSMGLASALAYEIEPESIKKQAKKWGFPKFKFLDGTRRVSDTQGYVIGNETTVIIAFRGTEKKMSDWQTDGNFMHMEGPLGKAHKGFNNALNSVLIEMTEGLTKFRDNEQSLWITGHSLGAALATLATASLLEAKRDVTGLYTFGSPRVGDQNFADAFSREIGDRTFRVVNGNDVVTRVPPQLNGYKHVGEVIFFNAEGKLEKEPTAWAQLKERVKIQLNAEILDGELSSVSHHLLDSADGYLVALQKNL